MEQGDIVHGHSITHASGRYNSRLSGRLASLQAACEIMHGRGTLCVWADSAPSSPSAADARGSRWPSNDRSLRSGNRRISMGRTWEGVGMRGKLAGGRARSVTYRKLYAVMMIVCFPHTHTHTHTAVLHVPLALWE